MSRQCSDYHMRPREEHDRNDLPGLKSKARCVSQSLSKTRHTHTHNGIVSNETLFRLLRKGQDEEQHYRRRDPDKTGPQSHPLFVFRASFSANTGTVSRQPELHQGNNPSEERITAGLSAPKRIDGRTARADRRDPRIRNTAVEKRGVLMLSLGSFAAPGTAACRAARLASGKACRSSLLIKRTRHTSGVMAVLVKLRCPGGPGGSRRYLGNKAKRTSVKKTIIQSKGKATRQRVIKVEHKGSSVVNSTLLGLKSADDEPRTRKDFST